VTRKSVDPTVKIPSREVIVTRQGPILLVTINRPDARNAMTKAAAELMAEAMDELDGDSSLAVGVITGEGGNFCSGMDLKGFIAGEIAEVDGRGFAGITERPPLKPLIAAVEGFALAGGFEIVLACDLVVAGDGAVFGLPEITRGLVAGQGGLLRLPRRMPPLIAMEYALTGSRIAAVEALRWGLINRLVPAGAALGEAMTLATKIAANAPLATRATKAIVNGTANWDQSRIWSLQSSIVKDVLTSQDAREGALAFKEKRDPEWQGI
jgi:enoyl-CoA hydratase